VQLGTVAQCWCYPFKSMQGSSVPSLEIGTHGVAGDRAYALMDSATGRVLSAKAVKALLDAAADEAQVVLPDGTVVALGSPDRDEVLSAWIGRDVTVLHLEQGEVPEPGLAYEMTFDPPDDDAEMYDIPLPAHGFVDLAPLHLVATSTLEGCRAARPDLDWDVRRFRPNLVVDHDGVTFAEDDWVGSRLAIGGSCVVEVAQPTVRCAMPLRAQPAGAGGGALDRQPELFRAMNELHAAAPNHLGAYLDVVVPGHVAVGDPVVLLDADND
jgi:uncharacterized protein YcbX